MNTLTYEQAASMIEQLKPFTVLGPWETDDDGFNYRKSIQGSLSAGAAWFYAEDGTNFLWYGYIVDVGTNQSVRTRNFNTPAPAMAAVDAILAQRSDILAAGITPTTGEQA